MKDFKDILGFYSLDTAVPILDLAAKELQKAYSTKCSALLLLTLLTGGDKSKMRKACLKINRIADEQKCPIRRAIADKASLAIKMEL